MTPWRSGTEGPPLFTLHSLSAPAPALQERRRAHAPSPATLKASTEFNNTDPCRASQSPADFVKRCDVHPVQPRQARRRSSSTTSSSAAALYENNLVEARRRSTTTTSSSAVAFYEYYHLQSTTSYKYNTTLRDQRYNNINLNEYTASVYVLQVASSST